MPKWVDPIPALKRQVADELLGVIGEFSQSFAAALIYTTQSRISDLRRGKLETMSLERMIEMLSRTRRVVEIKIHPPPRIVAGAASRVGENAARSRTMGRTG